ncbi:MAG: hypothetical protein ACKOA1_12950, partial [Bacteroidota bacterium]
MKHRFISALGVLFTLTISAYAMQSRSAGDINGFKQNGQVFNVSLTYAKAQIHVISPSIVRVRLAKNEFEDDFSYAVVGKPSTCSIRLEDK